MNDERKEIDLMTASDRFAPLPCKTPVGHPHDKYITIPHMALICHKCGKDDRPRYFGEGRQWLCDICAEGKGETLYRDETERILGHNMAGKYKGLAIERHRAEKALALKKYPISHGKVKFD